MTDPSRPSRALEEWLSDLDHWLVSTHAIFSSTFLETKKAELRDLFSRAEAQGRAAQQEQTPFKDYGVYSRQTERELSENYTSNESRSPDGDILTNASASGGEQRASYELGRLGDAASANALQVTKAGSEPADSRSTPWPQTSWIMTDRPPTPPPSVKEAWEKRLEESKGAAEYQNKAGTEPIEAPGSTTPSTPADAHTLAGQIRDFLAEPERRVTSRSYQLLLTAATVLEQLADALDRSARAEADLADVRVTLREIRAQQKEDYVRAQAAEAALAASQHREAEARLQGADMAASLHSGSNEWWMKSDLRARLVREAQKEGK